MIGVVITLYGLFALIAFLIGWTAFERERRYNWKLKVYIIMAALIWPVAWIGLAVYYLLDNHT